MAWFLFIDESGHDRKASPYEVLAGVAIQEQEVSSVISQLQEAETRCFGRRYSDGPRELKGRALLKRKVFRHRDLDADVEVADVISWGFRISQMTKPARAELASFAQQVADLRYHAVRERLGNPQFGIWSFAHISDLRTRSERDDGR